jgi:hypothetical protein
VPASDSVVAPTGGPADRDVLVQAWGDHILRTLPARAKALYSAGRFVSAEGSTAVFALPNAAHCDRCEDVQSVVEDAIAAHLGRPVTLTLVVDGSGDGSAVDPSRPGATSTSAGPSVSPSPAATAARQGLAGTAPNGAGNPASSAAPDADEEVFDPDDVVDAVPVESVAEARVLEAFPGAEEV